MSECVGGNALTWPGDSFWGYSFLDLRLAIVWLETRICLVIVRVRRRFCR